MTVSSLRRPSAATDETPLNATTPQSSAFQPTNIADRRLRRRRFLIVSPNLIMGATFKILSRHS
jgi:hypothetical protein